MTKSGHRAIFMEQVELNYSWMDNTKSDKFMTQINAASRSILVLLFAVITSIIYICIIT